MSVVRDASRRESCFDRWSYTTTEEPWRLRSMLAICNGEHGYECSKNLQNDFSGLCGGIGYERHALVSFAVNRVYAIRLCANDEGRATSFAVEKPR
jgi:hypothetical protein